jgi:hypothetical protein
MPASGRTRGGSNLVNLRPQIDWWNLRSRQKVHIDGHALDLIQEALKRKDLSCYSVVRKFDNVNLYSFFKGPNKGSIARSTLMLLCFWVGVDIENITGHILSIGKRRRYVGANFPLTVTPVWASLLGHSFFDGYTDRYMIRYSQYEEVHRNEYVSDVVKIFGKGMPINIPDNYERDIDLPQTAEELLLLAFNAQNTYSKECRIPPVLFRLTCKDPMYGWYFLKAAFIDEGTVCGGSLHVVRGVRNKGLAEDIQKLCDCLRIETKVSVSNKNDKLGNGYTVRLYSRSLDRFYRNVFPLIENTTSMKINRLKKMYFWQKHPVGRSTTTGRYINREVTYDGSL